MTRQNLPQEATLPKAVLTSAAKLTIEAAARWQLPERLELSLLLTNDEGLRVLNRTYRGQDKPTDVLSVPLWEQQPPTLPDNAALPLGDIAISLTRAAAQAQELGHSTLREAVFLLVHGLLHLLGYDHEQGIAEEQNMLTLQKQIMSQLGTGG
jgi:probable rRNA maturation factor